MRKDERRVESFGILKEVESGRAGPGGVREHGISEHTLPLEERCRRDGGERRSRLRELEEENRKLKRIVADQAVDLVALKDVIGRKW